jgi:hypothetical protein
MAPARAPTWAVRFDLGRKGTLMSVLLWASGFVSGAVVAGIVTTIYFLELKPEKSNSQV